MKYAHGTNDGVFSFVSTKPQIQQDFDLFMAKYHGQPGYWYSQFPVKERLVNGLDESWALLADVGDGNGTT
jgi:hypothetical protein